MMQDQDSFITLPPAPQTMFLEEDFEYIEILGRGGFGEVWRAIDKNLHRTVAIKMIRPQRTELIETCFHMLTRESQILARFQHPNLILIHALRRQNEKLAIVSEYIDGGSLKDRLETSMLSVGKALGYIADVAGALAMIHSEDIVHCDIKPANILIRSKSDEAVLCDFGLASIVGQEGPKGGTPLFTAPEVFVGKPCPESDVYSLAATLIYAVAKDQLPHSFPIAQAYNPSDEVLAPFTTSLAIFLRSCLSPQPSRRPSLAKFAERTRADLNQSMLDQLTFDLSQDSSVAAPGIVSIECIALSNHNLVRKAESGNLSFRPVRDLKKVLPSSLRAKTGERVLIRVTANQVGHLTILNVGPTGNLNILEENLPVTTPGTHWECETVLAPPQGQERVFAIWTKQPFVRSMDLQDEPLDYDALFDGARSLSRRATRDLVRIDQSARSQQVKQKSVAVVEIEHVC